MSDEKSGKGKDEKKRSLVSGASEGLPYALPAPFPEEEDITIWPEGAAFFARGWGSEDAKALRRSEAAPSDGSVKFQDYVFMARVKGGRAVLYMLPIGYDDFSGKDDEGKPVSYKGHWNAKGLDQFGEHFGNAWVKAAQPAGGDHTKLHRTAAKILREVFGVDINEHLSWEESVARREYVLSGAIFKGEKYLIRQIKNRSARTNKPAVQWDEDYMEFTSRFSGRFDCAIPKAIMERILAVMEKQLPKMVNAYMESFLRQNPQWASKRDQLIWSQEFMHEHAYDFENYETEEEWQKLFAKPTERDSNGEDGLMRALRGKYKELPNKWLKKFMRLGVRLNNTNHKGETALIIAVDKGAEKTVEALITEGSNVESLTYFGETPVSIAMNRKYFNIVALLFVEGASVDLDSCNDFAFIDKALSLVAQKDDCEKFSMLVQVFSRAYGMAFTFLPMIVKCDAQKILAKMAEQSEASILYSSLIRRTVKDFLTQVGEGQADMFACAIRVLNAFPEVDYEPSVFIHYYLANLAENEIPHYLLTCLGVSDKSEAKSSQRQIPALSNPSFKSSLVRDLLVYYQNDSGHLTSVSPKVKAHMIGVLQGMAPLSLALQSAGQFSMGEKPGVRKPEQKLREQDKSDKPAADEAAESPPITGYDE